MTMDVAGSTSTGAAVRWGGAPHAFELRSTDARVIERAAVVFRPWTGSTDVEPTRVWTIAPARDHAGHWTLQTSGASPVLLPADPRLAVRRVEYLAVQAIFEGPPEVLTVHGALVAKGDRGVLVAGVPEAGKSTLACAAWQRGFSLLGDDVALVDLETLTARPAPRRVSLRRSSRSLVGADLWARIERAPATDTTDEGCVFHPDEVHGTRPASVRLAAMLFLSRAGAPPMTAVIRPLAPAHALLALLPCSNLARRIDTGALIGRFAPHMASVRAYDLRRADLDAMVSAIAGVLES